MGDTETHGDCGRCAALCCVALAFDRSALFAFDKAAGVACPHLTPRGACAIHADLEARGFAGCARYDCAGAGQRVTQEVFGGRSWRDDPAQALAMLEAFSAMRHVHELLGLVETARALPLAPAQAGRRDELERALQPPAAGWSEGALDAFERGPIPAEVRAFLKTVRDVTPASVGANIPDRVRRSPARLVRAPGPGPRRP